MLIAQAQRFGGKCVDIKDKTVLVLGGYGLVGIAVCRDLLEEEPAKLFVASLRQEQAEKAVIDLQACSPKSKTEILPAWGDLLLRSEWQQLGDNVHPRVAVLDDPLLRKRLVADILEELDDEIMGSSLLFQLITGKAAETEGSPADIVIDCVNTATAVAYQNIYQTARRLEDLIEDESQTDWPEEVERLLASLYVPQLVRHVQILYEALLAAGTKAYIKVGTSGTGGMGLNIPYTHGEEKPSRVLLSKSAIAGAQTMLTFLLARTPGGPAIVKEIKPTAAIAWKSIEYGLVHGGGRQFPLYDCEPEDALALSEPATLQAEGTFGSPTGEFLESVYIDTGENGLFALGEFTAITTLGQMQFVTPEEIAADVLAELRGGNTGHDVISSLDASATGPSYRAGFLREAAIKRMRKLEQRHEADSIAFELLGPPRLSKLLFEAYLLKRVSGTMAVAIRGKPETLASQCWELISNDARLRQHILSIGIPILTPAGDRILRGPVIKAVDAHHGWVDLTADNIARWQARLQAIKTATQVVLEGDTSSRYDRTYQAMREWHDDDSIDVGEIVGWLFIHEEEGRRGKD
jgi:NAD(P)-dependent dehydrogenase (short-subunit alcohol dehydrogenase family)